MPGRGRPRSTRVAVAPKAPSGTINAFARVSKPTTIGKDLLAKTSAVEVIAASIVTAQGSSRKRKALGSLEPEEIANTPNALPSLAASSKRQRLNQEASTPKPKRQRSQKERGRATVACDNPESIEAQQAGALFERLNLQSSPSTGTCSPLTASTPATTIPDSEEEDGIDTPWPRELIDLTDLHTAFLKSLTIHYAHNGRNSPVDLRAVYPSIAQAWGKRKVTVDDIRLCVGVTEASAPFFLSDYGRGKICIEIHQQHVDAPLNETNLGHAFETQLRTLWCTRLAAGTDISDFLLGLHKASIRKCESATKISPLFAKGQRTLQELKNGIELRKEEKETKAHVVAATNPDGSKMNLLDRIRYKELLLAQQGVGPTPEELERRAALQRADDIAAVVGMLGKATAQGQKRVSFALPTLLQKLKDSLRLPISKEEGTACVRLLASEIAPEWLRIVRIGARDNVVVQTDLQPSRATIQERVKALSA